MGRSARLLEFARHFIWMRKNVMNAKLDSGVTTRPVTRQTFDEVLVPTYAPAAMVPVRAAGLDVWDQEGKHYLDFTSGIAVSSLGHCNPVLVDAVTRQINTLWHLGNGYTNEPVLRLASALTEATFADRAFFCNSGAEANEAALKLARKYAHTKFGPHKSRIVSCLSSFHGRTLFTVSVGGQPKYTEGFEPLPQEINHIPYNDIERRAPPSRRRRRRDRRADPGRGRRDPGRHRLT
jgi:succinylornithine aminotransferase